MPHAVQADRTAAKITQLPVDGGQAYGHGHVEDCHRGLGSVPLPAGVHRVAGQEPEGVGVLDVGLGLAQGVGEGDQWDLQVQAWPLGGRQCTGACEGEGGLDEGSGK